MLSFGDSEILIERGVRPDLAIQLSDIGVCYRFQKERVFSLKEAIIGRVRDAFNRAQTPPAQDSEDYWAIRHLNIEVPKGSCVGITGRNGSGKSTTLRVISGVLHPSEGEYWVRGRVSALVELGAGFDPELTGRENIYLGGSVAGLSRKEVDKKIDRIIDFAELGEFIDIPVKNYSSGMYARLGFSVATDVDPDLLIVDEILAVGDPPFQAKCIDRMRKFRASGKTILFVSHDINSILSFCSELITLDGGRIAERKPLPAAQP